MLLLLKMKLTINNLESKFSGEDNIISSHDSELKYYPEMFLSARPANEGRIIAWGDYTSISGKNGSENFGIAVFKNDKLVGELNAFETICFLNIKNDLDRFLVSFPNQHCNFPDSSYQGVPNNMSYVFL